MKKNIFLLFILLFLAGCSDGKVRLGGTVTFDDGTPLTSGAVIFATDTFQASGSIGFEGKYTMGSVTINDGLPKGTYKVYIIGASEEISVEDGLETHSLIDPQYDNYSSTPLTCEVPAPKNIFNIIVPKNPTPKMSQ
ncbi:MAG: lipoprotein [Planctomycetaceae bacterium]|jgi:hypothetical protein|nr:lipoprotein [Planctomycetaceae bacterium]